MTNLTSVSLPTTLTSISGNAFSGCSKLTFIKIPGSVTSFGDENPFSGCNSLTDIYYVGTESEWQAIENYQSCAGANVNYHFLTLIEATDSTCTEAGHDSYYIFDNAEDAGIYSTAKAPITKIPYKPLLNHTLTEHEEVAATYTETGTEAYWSCDVCGKLFSDEKAKTEIEAPIIIAKIPPVNTTGPILSGDEKINCYINMPGNGELFQGGDVWQNSQVVDIWVQNVSYFVDNFPGTDPVWTLRKVSGQALEIDAEPKTYGTMSRCYRGELTELPAETGDSVYEVTCTWGGVTTTKTITIHCLDIEWPTGLINIEDTVYTYVGAKLSFNPQIAPEGWQVPGYPQLRWGFDDEADEFAITVPTKKDESTDPYLDINDRKDLRIKASGTYESTYLITSDRVSVGRLVTFVIDENPEWIFKLPTGIKTIEESAFEGIWAESVYIPEGCETIEAEAFEGSNISVIFIPASVKTIGDNALPKDVFIYTPANSPASIWAADHGFEEYQIVTKAE